MMGRAPCLFRAVSLLLIVTCVALKAPSRAQEVATILRDKEWRAAGVCVGVDQCGFCWITNNLYPAASLDIRPPREISVLIAGGRDETPVILRIGQQSFSLSPKDGDTFGATEADSIRIIGAMQEAASLTVRVGNPASAARYEFGLAEFPRVYAALLKACRIPPR